MKKLETKQEQEGAEFKPRSEHKEILSKSTRQSEMNLLREEKRQWEADKLELD